MKLIQQTALVILTVFVCCTNVWADVKPAGIFGDHMVLQRDRDVPVWGWAEPGQTVTVEFAGQKVSAKTDADGKWMVRLKPMPACADGREMVIRGPKNTVTLKDILVGEVWLCSGQSNMAWRVANCDNAKQEIADANYPQIRHITVARRPNANLSKDTSGSWQVCSLDTVGGFTAVGYFFGRYLYKTLDVPVGLINSSWGGTHAEAWTPQDTLRAGNINSGMLEHYDNCVKNLEALTREYKKEIDEQNRLKKEGKLTERQLDPGNQGFAKGYANLDFDDTQWKNTTLPKILVEYHQMDGAMWFRRKVTIPAGWAGKDLTLRLGPIDDYDVTYFNGRQVGRTDKTTAGWWTHPRKYTVPGELVKPGPAVIAVRMFDDYGDGGFGGAESDMKLIGPDQSLSLAGAWKSKFEVELSTSRLIKNIPAPIGPKSHNAPGGLYGGMIHPLIPYAIRGAIWYQGESNTGRAGEYAKLLSTMIGEWRKRWGQGEFPFGIVQLANYMAPQTKPNAMDGWTRLCEAQTDVARTVPNTGLAVINDIGDAKNIHPKNKQDVGKRLALWALATVYGKNDLVYSGPVFKDMNIEGDTIRVSFDHVGEGLMTKGPKVTGFTIAGNDGVFHWADAKIDGDTVLVWSKDVPAPRHVRYGMASNPPVNLYNKAQLPAVPFRTDR